MTRGRSAGSRGCDAALASVLAGLVGLPAGETDQRLAELGVRVRTAELSLEVLRGPCSPGDGQLGPRRGPDARLARDFYRFAADPSLDAPFSDETWVGIESGPTSVSLDEVERRHLHAWELDVGYAEAEGPFSALDTLAASGGYYELRSGIAATCPRGNAEASRHRLGSP